MEMNPIYGDEPTIKLERPPAEILAPTVRQRRRLLGALESFDDDQWAHSTRCDGWSARDVIVHLDGTNGFWTYSIASGLRGEPTEVMTTFDPVVTPAAMVEASTSSPSEVLEQFAASSTALIDLLESIDEDGWSLPAEAPPGHLSISAVTHHALWDSWTHERDILLPMGVTPEEEPDEIVSCLWYAAALSPAFAVNQTPELTGRMGISATDPDLVLDVELDGAVTVRTGSVDVEDGPEFALNGDAVQLVEALSLRGSLEQPIPPEASWMLSGLARVFDAA